MRRRHGVMVGKRVRVCFGSGIDSGKTGIVIPRDKLKTDGHLIPLLEGHYKPLQKDEEVIQCDNGEIITMYRSRLIELQ